MKEFFRNCGVPFCGAPLFRVYILHLEASSVVPFLGFVMFLVRMFGMESKVERFGKIQVACRAPKGSFEGASRG